MISVELHAALESLNLTHQQLARLLGYDERTMRYWLAGDRAIPSAVAILVRLLLSGKISFCDVDKAKPRECHRGLCSFEHRLAPVADHGGARRKTHHRRRVEPSRSKV